MTRTAHLDPTTVRTARRRTIIARGTRPTAPAALSEPERALEAERLAGALARWYAETLAGRRDVRQLRALLTPRVEHRVLGAVLRERARVRLGSPSTTASVTVRRTLVHAVGDRYEAVVMVDDGTRVHAVAAVLHAGAKGWTVSELARPEDGVPALTPPVIR